MMPRLVVGSQRRTDKLRGVPNHTGSIGRQCALIPCTEPMHRIHARIPYTASLYQSLPAELNVWGPPVFRHCE